MPTAANASLISIRSRSPTARPALPSAWLIALDGCDCSELSGPATLPCAPISASQVSPNSCAFSLRITTTAAAPSEICEDVPAVIVPSLANAGRSLASASTVVSARMPSSSRHSIGSPRRCGMSTGAISSSYAVLLRECGPLVRAGRELVLLLAGQPEASVDAVRRLPHRDVVEDVGEPVVGHRVQNLDRAVLVTRSRLRQQVRRVGHRLLTAGNDDVELAGPDELVGKRDGVQARQADLVDRDRRDGQRDAGLVRSLPGRDLPGAGLQHLAHDDVLHLLGAYARLVQRSLDRETTEVGPGEVLERAEQPAHRGARAVDDDRAAHDDLLERVLARHSSQRVRSRARV